MLQTGGILKGIRGKVVNFEPVVLFTPFAHMKGKNFYITDKDCPKKGRWGDMPHT
jgi:hypothetical protein